MKSIYKNFFAIAVILFICMFFSCKKAETNEIGWTGNLYVGDSVHFLFQGTVPFGTAFLWNFGDGGTSTLPNPVYCYLTPISKTYTVTLMLNVDSAHLITNKIYISIEDPHNPVHQFYYTSGVPIIGDTVNFYSNVLPDSAFLWDFGDGTTSTKAKPIHIYTAAGSYLVKLRINGSSALVYCAYPTINISKDPVYTHLIAGMKLWHHSYTDAVPWPPYHTTYTEPDISFAINYINAISISIGQETFLYSAFNSTDSILTFVDDDYYRQYYRHVYFNHYTGSIIYTRDMHQSAASGSTNDYYITP